MHDQSSLTNLSMSEHANVAPSLADPAMLALVIAGILPQSSSRVDSQSCVLGLQPLSMAAEVMAKRLCLLFIGSACFSAARQGIGA